MGFQPQRLALLVVAAIALFALAGCRGDVIVGGEPDGASIADGDDFGLVLGGLRAVHPRPDPTE